jgi:predicted AlkP superfamily pyrophosphatase or phosphodiesterase
MKLSRCVAGLVLLATAVIAQPRPKHVIVIGVDGLGGAAFAEGKVPRMRKLMEQGAWTLQARGVMPTVSSPNWASMIMGAGPEQHGVISNEWEPDKFAIAPTCQGMAATFPTMFGLLRQQRPGSVIGVLHDWEGFGRLVEKAAPTQMRHVKGSPAATAAAIQYLKTSRPELLFLHLDDVDHAGHDHGWWGPEYKAAVEMVDGLIGQVVDAVEGAGIGKQTVILVTADHGGSGKKHGGNTMGELEIPWIAAGQGIARRQIREPVNTYDTAATVAALLGLKPPPGCWVGRPVSSAFLSKK